MKQQSETSFSRLHLFTPEEGVFPNSGSDAILHHILSDFNMWSRTGSCYPETKNKEMSQWQTAPAPSTLWQFEPPSLQLWQKHRCSNSLSTQVTGNKICLPFHHHHSSFTPSSPSFIGWPHKDACRIYSQLTFVFIITLSSWYFVM